MFQPRPIYKGAFVCGVFSSERNDQLHEEEIRRVIAVNRNAEQRAARISRLNGDGSDRRDVAQEVVLKFNSRGTIMGRR